MTRGGVTRRLIRWADGKDSVRAVLLTGTRANPRGPVDILSDYDVVLVVEDVGCSVLVDKGGLFDTMPAPTHTAYVPPRPDEGAYLATVNNFFSDAPYVAKCLKRDELMPAKWCLDVEMRHNYLPPMLEWRMELDHGWSESAGNLGKGLKKRLPPDTWGTRGHLRRRRDRGELGGAVSADSALSAGGDGSC